MNRHTFHCLACMIVIALLALAGCDRSPVGAASPATRPASRLNVVATTSIIGDFARIIGGNDINLAILVGPGGDPHDYQPVPADSVTLFNADLLLENGMGLETWLDKVYAASHSQASRIIATWAVSARHVPGNVNGDLDPHVWQDVRLARVMVENVRDAFRLADPAHGLAYQQRAAVYLSQLSDLHDWILDQVHSLPVPLRKLVTSHDAFGYFGLAYGMDISQSALESVSSETTDPSARQIASTIDQIKALGVPVIFLENTQNPQLTTQIAAEAHVKIGPPLYSDALGPPGSAGDTYIHMMQYNVNTMVSALRP